MVNTQLTKPHHLIAYILQRLNKSAGMVELVKQVYLLDVEYYRLFGKTLSGLSYIREKLGPYTNEIGKIASELENLGIISINIIPSSGLSPIPKKSHLFSKKTFKPEVDKVEEELISEFLKKIKYLTPKQLEKLAYQTEPMVEILNNEKVLKKPLTGYPLNFSLIKRDEFMKKWLKNQGKFKNEEDLQYEEFLLKEKQELASLLSH